MLKIKNPPWLPLLNALHISWRDSEILKGNDPDPYLEEQLRAAGKWPRVPQSAGQNGPGLAITPP
jgi:hypothetical protein